MGEFETVIMMRRGTHSTKKKGEEGPVGFAQTGALPRSSELRSEGFYVHVLVDLGLKMSVYLIRSSNQMKHTHIIPQNTQPTTLIKCPSVVSKPRTLTHISRTVYRIYIGAPFDTGPDGQRKGQKESCENLITLFPLSREPWHVFCLHKQGSRKFFYWWFQLAVMY